MDERITYQSRSAAADGHLLSPSPADVSGRPGWGDAATIAEEIQLTTVPADAFGFPGWVTVMLASHPVRHFPSEELANAFIQGSDRTYTLAELAEACTVAYSRGLAMAQIGEHPIALGGHGAVLFPTLPLPDQLASIEWSHGQDGGTPGWRLASDQANSAIAELADRERHWQALLTAVDDMIAWLASQTVVAWPSALARGLTAAANPLRRKPAKT